MICWIEKGGNVRKYAFAGTKILLSVNKAIVADMTRSLIRTTL